MPSSENSLEQSLAYKQASLKKAQEVHLAAKRYLSTISPPSTNPINDADTKLLLDNNFYWEGITQELEKKYQLYQQTTKRLQSDIGWPQKNLQELPEREFKERVTIRDLINPHTPHEDQVKAQAIRIAILQATLSCLILIIFNLAWITKILSLVSIGVAFPMHYFAVAESICMINFAISLISKISLKSINSGPEAEVKSAIDHELDRGIKEKRWGKVTGFAYDHYTPIQSMLFVGFFISETLAFIAALTGYGFMNYVPGLLTHAQGLIDLSLTVISLVHNLLKLAHIHARSKELTYKEREFDLLATKKIEANNGNNSIIQNIKDIEKRAKNGDGLENWNVLQIRRDELNKELKTHKRDCVLAGVNLALFILQCSIPNLGHHIMHSWAEVMGAVNITTYAIGAAILMGIIFCARVCIIGLQAANTVSAKKEELQFSEFEVLGANLHATAMMATVS